MKVICNLQGIRNCLEIVCFVTPAGAVSQNGKDNHNEDREEDNDNQYLDGGKQKAAQGDDRTKQGYDEQYLAARPHSPLGGHRLKRNARPGADRGKAPRRNVRPLPALASAVIWKSTDRRPPLMKLTAVAVTPDPETCTVLEVVWLNPLPKMLTGTVVLIGPQSGEIRT